MLRKTTFTKTKYKDLFPSLSNKPSCYDEDFHEEIVSKLASSIIHHGVEVSAKIPVNTERVPAGLAEGAREEEVEGGLFFAIRINDIVVVISFKVIFFSSKDVSDIKSIHESEPTEHSDFI
jgi:hypothetical protein